MKVTQFVHLFTFAALAMSFTTAMSVANAAFMVETRATAGTGKGFGNFGYGGDTTSSSTSTAGSAAVGTTVGIGSIFSGNGNLSPDTYVFSYTPGVNVDNTVYAPNALLGSTTGFPGQGNRATGLVGGASGTYNVYMTSPPTTNISGGNTTFTVTQNGPNVVVVASLNDGGTGPDTDPGAAFVGGASNAWFKLGTVDLLAGTTYSVTQAAGSNTFVSMRSAAVMWEYVGPTIPEPATLALAGMGLIGLCTVARRKNA